ncbi:hypothetical protein OIU85_025494 [Salix viminalis]|uniref:Extensin domain-containing protein n=1 Tax=Salix viminalis TaxID=40686 RepID=A0A9Q0TLR6_SALVM|nr:hypothetical protein OIU85_025494 [Salix viminalis]
MPNNMKTPMARALFLPTILALVGLAAINGTQARNLPDSYGLKVAIIAAYGRRYSPPPSPIPSPSSKELTSNYERYSSPPPRSPKTDPSIGQVTTSNGRTLRSPPPSPRPATPKGELEIGSPSDDGCISMITNFERPLPSPPPPPYPATPASHITFNLEPKVHARSPPGEYVYSS